MIQELSETPEYKDEVASIGFSTWKEECHLLGIHSVEDYKKSMGRTVIAVQDGLIGQVSIDECDLETHKHLSPWLCSLYVKSPYRLQGIAGRLIEYVVKDYDVLYLWCTEDLCPFYAKHGFVKMDCVGKKRIMVRFKSKMI